jgi:hypothetical protein
MYSIRRTLRGPSVLPKTQRNRAVLFRTRFTLLWRSEIHINPKIDADALNRLRRRFCVRPKMHHIYQGQRRQYAGKSACVYGIFSMNNKIENKTNLNGLYFQPNLTWTHPILSNSVTVCTTENTTESRSSYEHVSKCCGEAKSTSIQKSTPTPWTDVGVAFVCTVKYIPSVKDSEGSTMVSAHASTVYVVWKIKSKTKQMSLTLLPT